MRWIVGLLVALLTLAGCRPAPPRPLQLTVSDSDVEQRVMALQGLMMGYADNHLMLFSEAMDNLIAVSEDPAVEAWARRTRFSAAQGMLANATAPSPIAGILDSVVTASLRRRVIEQHWIPTLLGQKYGPLVLPTAIELEREAWQMAEALLDSGSQQELRRIIEDHRRQFPDQIYITIVRVRELSAFRDKPRPGTNSTGSLLSLLYLDPLASLDPVARELRESRLLAERLTFLAMRMPTLLGWQVELASRDVLDGPRVGQALQQMDLLTRDTRDFADAVVSFSDSVKQFVAGIDQTVQSAVVRLGEEAEQVRAQAAGDLHALAEQQRTEFGKLIDTQRLATLEQADALLSQQLEQAISRLDLALASAREQTFADVEATATRLGAQTQLLVETQGGALVDKLFLRGVVLVVLALLGGLLVAHINRRLDARAQGLRRDRDDEPDNPLRRAA
jgi:hypothetical protein